MKILLIALPLILGGVRAVPLGSGGTCISNVCSEGWGDETLCDGDKDMDDAQTDCANPLGPLCSPTSCSSELVSPLVENAKSGVAAYAPGSDLRSTYHLVLGNGTCELPNPGGVLPGSGVALAAQASPPSTIPSSPMAPLVGPPMVQVPPLPTRYAVGVHAIPANASLGGDFHGATIVRVNSPLLFLAVVVNASTYASFADATRADPNVRYCEVDGVARALLTPNDALYALQYAPQHTHLDLAWSTTLGTTAKTICIVDTGIFAAHEDLAGTRYLGGYNFLTNTPNPVDDQGHGTHVAGIAAATTNNGLGIAGASQAAFKAVKVLDSNGIGQWSDVASGITWCADNGGDIISMSLGGLAPTTAVGDAVEYAHGHGSLVIAAAGNNGPCSDCIGYPAKYAHVLAVTCTDASDATCSFSSSGPESDIAAPGDSILSTCFTGASDYCVKSGTSMSTPLVAGIAALVWSHTPGLSNDGVRAILECTAHDMGTPGWDEAYGYGIVDANAALAAASGSGCSSFQPVVHCGALVTVNGAPISGAYRGPVTVKVNHPAGTSLTLVSFSSSDHASLIVTPLGGDAWQVAGPGSTTRTITAHVQLDCGTALERSWAQTN